MVFGRHPTEDLRVKPPLHVISRGKLSSSEDVCIIKSKETCSRRITRT